MKELDVFMGAARRRKKQMLALRNKNWTDERIGAKYGISYQRVGQILGPKKARKP